MNPQAWAALNRRVPVPASPTRIQRARLRRIANQIKRWNLGVLRHDYPLDSASQAVPVVFASMRSGVRGGRFRHVRTHHLSLNEMMDLAGLLRVPHHPLREARKAS